MPPLGDSFVKANEAEATSEGTDGNTKTTEKADGEETTIDSRQGTEGGLSTNVEPPSGPTDSRPGFRVRQNFSAIAVGLDFCGEDVQPLAEEGGGGEKEVNDECSDDGEEEEEEEEEGEEEEEEEEGEEEKEGEEEGEEEDVNNDEEEEQIKEDDMENEGQLDEDSVEEDEGGQAIEGIASAPVEHRGTLVAVGVPEASPGDPTEWTTPSPKRYSVSVSPFVARVEAVGSAKVAGNNTGKRAKASDKQESPRGKP